MAEKEAAKIILDAGKKLARQTRFNKDSLVELLRKVEKDAFPVLGQSSSLRSAIEPLSDSLTRQELLQHKDKDVRALVAICLCETIRVLAPDPPFSDEIFREIFKLFISMFIELADKKSPHFTRRVKILETVAKCRCCLLMLDIGCDDLVLEMFNVFFSVVRVDLQNLFREMLSIMTLILEEHVSEPLLNVILRNLLKEEKGQGAAPASYELAVSLLQHCAEKLEPFVREFLTSSILERETVSTELKEYYHEIIVEIYQYAPQMLLTVIPNLSHELVTDQVDVRIKAVRLLKKLFALPGHHFAQDYRQLFVEFLKRFSDKSAEVRISALQCVKACYMACPSGSETLEVLAALEGRLLDFDDKVRTQAVITVCDLAKSNLRCISAELILQAIDRLRDLKVSVRKNALQKLLDLYRDYCNQCSESCVLLDHFEQIPCRAMMLCYDKDNDFGPQNMELVLAENLFPVDLSVDGRMRHWIFLFSVFKDVHLKALTSILIQKWRLQREMCAFLTLREKEKENESDEVQKKFEASFKKMSRSFVDPKQAEERFKWLDEMKDKTIFKVLMELLDEQTSFKTAQTIREKLLERVGSKHRLYEFLRILSLKCSFNIFGSEHVSYILSDLSRKNDANKHLEASSVDLLLTVVSIYPSLLRGSEEKLKMLLSNDENPFTEKLLQILSKAGRYMSIKFSDIFPSLERTCLEGTRLQSKYAISAIAALSGPDHLAFLSLSKKLLRSLDDRRNISTVLQSLGCILQYSMPAFQSQEIEIFCKVQNFIYKSVVQASNDRVSSDGEDSGCSISCKLKIQGLKALVKSVLSHQEIDARDRIADILKILSNILPEGEISDDIFFSGGDKAHIRLAAAKSVLKLARRWDLYISPQIFHLTVLKAKDPSSHVRGVFLNKIHKLLKQRAIPARYGCAFALAASDDLKDVQADSLRYLEEFVTEYSREARMSQHSAKEDQERMTDYAEYVVVFLIHVLAHDPCFPSENVQDEEIYASFCRPLVVMLQAFISAKNDSDGAFARIFSIFHAIKKTEDAVDVSKTHKLHTVAEIGVQIVTAISTNGLSSPTPGRTLLPSSFYKANLNSPMESPFEKNFAEKVLDIIRFDICGANSSLVKRTRKLKDDDSQSDRLKHTSMSTLPHKLADNLRSKRKGTENSYSQNYNKTLEKHVNTREKDKHVVSSTATRAMGIKQHKKGPSSKTASTLGRDRFLSSCGSITTKSSLTESGEQKKDMMQCCFQENNRKTRNSVAKSFGMSETIAKKHSNSKEVGDMGDVQIGQRIKLWSPVDKCFYSGSIHEYDSQNSSHKIMYDNGEVELVRLASEKWEIVSSVSLINEEVNNIHSTPRRCQEKHATAASTCDPVAESSITNLKESPIEGDKGSELETILQDRRKGANDNEVVPLTGVGKRKGEKLVSIQSDVPVADDTIARRTRSRKV